MSGRWLFREEAPTRALPHVHARIRFTDGSELWFQDPRRFGLLKLAATSALETQPDLRVLGPDPIASPPTGESLHAMGRRARTPIKVFLLDQKRIAGIGNIYASEILHRAFVDPRRASGLSAVEWERRARISAVLAGHRPDGHHLQQLPHALERAGGLRRAAARLRPRRRALPPLRQAHSAPGAGPALDLLLSGLPEAPKMIVAGGPPDL
jgi:formamidopyrimidine-DNA glycosylase